jgi:hypothetical protein
MIIKRPGYYVERRYFRDNFNQAVGRAKFLAQEYGRPIPVMFLAHEDVGHPNTAIPYEVVKCVSVTLPGGTLPAPSSSFSSEEVLRCFS